MSQRCFLLLSSRSSDNLTIDEKLEFSDTNDYNTNSSSVWSEKFKNNFYVSHRSVHSVINIIGLRETSHVSECVNGLINTTSSIELVRSGGHGFSTPYFIQSVQSKKMDDDDFNPPIMSSNLESISDLPVLKIAQSFSTNENSNVTNSSQLMYAPYYEQLSQPNHPLPQLLSPESPISIILSSSSSSTSPSPSVIVVTPSSSATTSHKKSRKSLDLQPLHLQIKHHRTSLTDINQCMSGGDNIANNYLDLNHRICQDRNNSSVDGFDNKNKFKSLLTWTLLGGGGYQDERVDCQQYPQEVQQQLLHGLNNKFMNINSSNSGKSNNIDNQNFLPNDELFENTYKYHQKNISQISNSTHISNTNVMKTTNVHFRTKSSVSSCQNFKSDIRIEVLGLQGSGKTALINRIVQGMFDNENNNEDSRTTDSNESTLNVRYKLIGATSTSRVRLCLHEEDSHIFEKRLLQPITAITTAATSNGKTTNNSEYQSNSHYDTSSSPMHLEVILLAIDLTSPKCKSSTTLLLHLRSYLSFIRQQKLLKRLVILVGTKCDQSSQETKILMKYFIKAFDVYYIETSAKSGTNVEELCGFILTKVNFPQQNSSVKALGTVDTCQQKQRQHHKNSSSSSGSTSSIVYALTGLSRVGKWGRDGMMGQTAALGNNGSTNHSNLFLNPTASESLGSFTRGIDELRFESVSQRTVANVRLRSEMNICNDNHNIPCIKTSKKKMSNTNNILPRPVDGIADEGTGCGCSIQ